MTLLSGDSNQVFTANCVYRLLLYCVDCCSTFIISLSVCHVCSCLSVWLNIVSCWSKNVHWHGTILSCCNSNWWCICNSVHRDSSTYQGYWWSVYNRMWRWRWFCWSQTRKLTSREARTWWRMLFVSLTKYTCSVTTDAVYFDVSWCQNHFLLLQF